MEKRKKLRVLARFSPTNTDDLESELVNLVGAEAVFRYHMFNDDDGTPYSGQWVLTTEDQRFGNYLFPEYDLEILQDKRID
jgi:hypothetical protein